VIRITSRVILLYCLLQTLAVLLALIGSPPTLYLVLLAFAALTLAWDFRSVSSVKSLKMSAALKLKGQVILGHKLEAELQLETFGAKFDLIEWSMPEHRAYSTKPGAGVMKRIFHTHQLDYVEIHEVEIKCRSRRGFWTVRAAVPLTPPIKVRIHPETVRLNPEDFVELFGGATLLHQGQRRRARGSHEDLFDSFRPYQYPDSLRVVDAKKSAQFSELLVRRFDTLHDHHLLICLDMGRNSSGQILNSERSDYYVSAAMKLAENAILSRDRVSLICYSDRIHFQVRRTRNLADFEPLLAGRFAKSYHVESTLLNLPRWINEVAGGRCIVVLLSDLERPNVQDSILEALPPVCVKHLTAVVGLSDPSNDPNLYLDRLHGRTSGDQELMADYLYALNANDRTTEFARKFSRFGGHSLTVDERRWTAAVSELYRLLRSSARAG